MRLTEVLHRAQRRKAMEMRDQFKKSIGNYRFMQVPVIKNSVALKQTRSKDMPCQQPFAILMQCWKDSNFDEGFCTKEKDSYEGCMKTFAADRKRVSAQQQKTELGGSWQERRNLSHAQANLLLKMYPRPKYEFNITHNFNKRLINPISFDEATVKTLETSIHKKLWRRG